jgi:hypothetical protein
MAKVIKKAQAGAKVRERILNELNKPIDAKATAKKKLEIAKKRSDIAISSVSQAAKKAPSKLKAGGMIKRADGSMSKKSKK